MEFLETLSRVCTVPEVRSELRAGTDSYPYVQRALDSIGDAIPVIALGESVDEAVTELESRLDAGEVQAFAVAAIYDGTLVTDDGPARTLAVTPVSQSLVPLAFRSEPPTITISPKRRVTSGSNNGSMTPTTGLLPVTSRLPLKSIRRSY